MYGKSLMPLPARKCWRIFAVAPSFAQANGCVTVYAVVNCLKFSLVLGSGKFGSIWSLSG